MLKCLITSIGTPAIHGTLQMLEGHGVTTYGADANPEVFSRGLVDHFVPVPLSQSSDYIPTLLELCEREGIELILFHTDADAFICAKRQDEFEQIGTRLLCSTAQVLERAMDKGRLYQTLKGEGSVIPEHALVTQENCEAVALAMGYPQKELIAKPPISYGARGVYWITEKPLPWDTRLRIPMATLSQVKKSLDRPILLMEALVGCEFSVDAVLGDKVSLAIPRRRDQIVGGGCSQNNPCPPPRPCRYHSPIGESSGAPSHLWDAIPVR